MIRTFIADDHPVVVKGLKRMLSDAPDVEIVGEATRARLVLTLLKERRPDILLLDIAFPDMSGLELLRMVKRQYASIQVIMVSMHPEGDFGPVTLAAGASAYVMKANAGACLLAAVRAVWGGKRYASAEVIEAVHAAKKPPADSQHVRLSARERQVFILLARGNPPIRIARELNLSRRTVFAHRAHILEKMHLQNNVELTQYAVKHDLIDFPDSTVA
jgi:DNA-binding NarL/FixJ family response regulator